MSNAGAKGKFAEWITADGLARIQGWARDGLTDEQIAREKIGIAPPTLYEWQKRFPEIRKALKDGKKPVDHAVENALLKSALGYEYEETVEEARVMEDGSTGVTYRKTYHRKMQPNVTAQIYWLKNRRPDKWRDKQETEVTMVSREIENEVEKMVSDAKARSN